MSASGGGSGSGQQGVTKTSLNIMGSSGDKSGGCDGGDEAIMITNDDATICKLSAISMGYWKDEFLQYFTPRPQLQHHQQMSQRKAPEINRGYWARTQGVYSLIVNSIKVLSSKNISNPNNGNDQNRTEACRIQIVNLGSGYDTLYWRLKNDQELLKYQNQVDVNNSSLNEVHQKFVISAFVDVDFPSNSSKKVNCIVKHSKNLLNNINNESEDEVKISKSDLHANNYHIIGVDLKNLKDFEDKIASCGLDKNIPTIFLSECVLVYMEFTASQQLLKWISNNFLTTVFINYEQVNMSDNFANIMLKNLNLRGCSLAGVEHCKDLETQKKRFQNCGWDDVKIWTMNQVYSLLPQNETKRIEKIEMLDEHELLKQLLEHYCLSICFKNDYNSKLYSSIDFEMKS